MFTNQMRMTGFSGIDVQDMVTQMMRAESFRLNRFTQQRQILSWQQESIRGLSTNIMSFRNAQTRIGAGGTIPGVGNSNNFRSLTANINNLTGSNNTGTNGISITTTNATRPGRHTIQVESVAQSHGLRGERQVAGATSQQISFDSFIGEAGNYSGNFGISVNGVTRQINLNLQNAALAIPADLTDASAQLANIRNSMSALEDAQSDLTDARTAMNTWARAQGSSLSGVTVAQMTADDFMDPTNTDSPFHALTQAQQDYFRDNLMADFDAATTAVENANEDIRIANEALQSNAAFMNNIASQINAGMPQFGTNPDGTLRASASFNASNNSLTITGTMGNTVNLTGGTGAEGVTVANMGFSTASTAFNTNQSLGDFMGFERVNTGSGYHWLDAGGNPILDDTVSFSINGVEFSFNLYENPDLTINQMMTQVNADTRSEVRLAFDGVNGAFTLESTRLGTSTQITSIADDSGILGRMFNPGGTGIDNARAAISDWISTTSPSIPFDLDDITASTFDPVDAFNNGDLTPDQRDEVIALLSNLNAAIAASIGDIEFTTTREATDAVVNVNGSRISRETNNFNIDGMNISLNAAATGQIFEVNMAGDTTETRQMILDFVNAYNDLVREIQGLSDVRRPRGQNGSLFQPLTDEQRASMSDREIEHWEAQARTGILHRDQDLRNLLNDMRNEMARGVTLSDGTTFSLANMGIRLSTTITDGALLSIDEAELDSALANNLGAVTALFSGDGALRANGTGAGGIGLGQRLDNALNHHVNPQGILGRLDQRAGVVGRASEGSNILQSRINEQDRRIDNMMRWLERRETSLFAQFSRMEQAMMQANTQMNFLDQFIWGG
ncbi:MAG: flagellar filament capping protein FliD [Defluviitaleaceae bacterium]|nr:flagellar filament capping protein FliD [Defluviitaleaceae bacterium]